VFEVCCVVDCCYETSVLSSLDIDCCCEGDVHVLNGIDCSCEGNEHVISYDCSNRGMYKCCDFNFSYGVITVYVLRFGVECFYGEGTCYGAGIYRSCEGFVYNIM
jgi:hypothetical protein